MTSSRKLPPPLATPELGHAIAAAAQVKRVVAFTDSQACSAAYWAASQADEIWVTPSARVGSIGVLLPVVDMTKALENEGIKVEVFRAGAYKGMGMPELSLTEQQRALLTAQVLELMEDFRAAVTGSGRPVAHEAMEGQTFTAVAAMNQNLIDGVVPSLDDLYALLA
jgi:ClpP class serine protease